MSKETEESPIKRRYFKTVPYCCILKMFNGFEKVVVLNDDEFTNATCSGINVAFNLHNGVNFFSDPKAPLDFTNQVIINFRFQYRNDSLGRFVFEE